MFGAVMSVSHLGPFMERCAPLVLPVGLGIKLNTIHSCLILLLCDQVVNLSTIICLSAEGTERDGEEESMLA